MFLYGHSVEDIETSFAIGAALQIEPQALLPLFGFRATSLAAISVYVIVLCETNFHNHPEIEISFDFSTTTPSALSLDFLRDYYGDEFYERQQPSCTNLRNAS
ncbi:MAG: hypothetical protein FWC89_08920 [Defluviitaleaceae bacterium]|nr:hypothetical protein [Defluviitaleaceae bacterium]